MISTVTTAPTAAHLASCSLDGDFCAIVRLHVAATRSRSRPVLRALSGAGWPIGTNAVGANIPNVDCIEADRGSLGRDHQTREQCMVCLDPTAFTDLIR